MKIIADIGGSRGRWQIVDNKIVKTIETNGFNPYTHKISSLHNILEILKLSVKSFEINKIIYYGAGINTLETKTIVEESIKNYFKKTQISVFSDLLGSCRALCKDKKGIVSILGTGSNSCYYDGNEINMQINPLGYLLGDEGSGYVLGKSYLKKYLRGELSDNIMKSFENEYQITTDNLKIIYEKNSNRWISEISKFIHENKDDRVIAKIIIDHFKYYFDEIICKYNSKKLYLSGSLAYYFINEISKVSNLYQIKIIKVLKDPINHLVDFHVK
tara:strand:- start:1581 stop:2399 length:819 start_codon:yes stop_codon:yes gene_type:complete